MRTAYSYEQLRIEIKQMLQESSTYAPFADQYAWWLLTALTHKSRTELMRSGAEAIPDDIVDTAAWTLYRLLRKHEPIQYIIGTVPFLQLTLTVTPPILIPRPETEEWVSALIASYTRQHCAPRNILDLCTGSGCIALALASAFPHAQVTGIDIHPQAVALAQQNAQQNNIHNVTFLQSDLYAQLTPAHQFDLIVANPPYIDPALWHTLEPSVHLWEDRNALIAEEQGLACIARIIAHAPAFLAQPTINRIPQLWIEIDTQQGHAVTQLFERHGFSDITISVDSAGNQRTVHGALSLS